MSQTFIIIKPDCLDRGLVGRVLTRFENRGLRIVGCQMRWKSEAWARNHYSHLEPEILEKNVAFMSAAPLVGIVLQGQIEVVAQIIGATWTPVPGSIRGDYATDITYNLVHSSDNEKIDDEIAAFFNIETDRVEPAGSENEAK